MEQKRKIIPPVYFVLTLIAMACLHQLLPIARFIAPPFSYAGVALLLLGMLLAAVSAEAFRKAGTPVIPFEKSTVLVTSGFYRYTRNPMYLGLLLLLIGAALLFGTVGALLPIPFFVWVIEARFIRGEERFLQEIFGDDYLEYKRRVRRWL